MKKSRNLGPVHTALLLCTPSRCCRFVVLEDIRAVIGILVSPRERNNGHAEGEDCLQLD